MRVLVLGGAGYVGSHAVRVLARRGHRVCVYDNFSSGVREFVNEFEVTVGDIRDRKTLMNALHGVDAVLHFAAHAYVRESVSDPRKYFANNTEGSLAVFNAALDVGVNHIVFSSTCATFGVVERGPISDDAKQHPTNPYGISKLFAEQALRAYHDAYGLQFVVLRYFNAAGADESGELGEIDAAEARAIPAALEVVAGERREFEIFGEDYQTEDGTCVRDYVHVNDLAEAHVLALEYLFGGGESSAFNLGTGTGSSVRQVLTTIREVTGFDVPTSIAPRRPGDPAVLIADPSRTHDVLKWKAQRGLREIVATAWNWMNSEKRRKLVRAHRASHSRQAECLSVHNQPLR